MNRHLRMAMVAAAALSATSASGQQPPNPTDAFLRTASKPINPDELMALVRELSAAGGEAQQ